jgi:ElaB/YqjD/DUF883 family membrane-anchored ribosome-binding protein
MDNIYSQAVEDQARKSARDVRKAGEGIREHFDEAVSRGKDAVEEFGSEAQAVADHARDYLESARKKVGKATERVTTYADDNTALVAVAAFGIGLLIGHLVTRRW